MGLNSLSIPFPDFQIQEIIEPDHFDVNNKYIVDKMNELLALVNAVTDSTVKGSSGADKISLTAISPFTKTKLQGLLEELIGYIQSTNGSTLIGSKSIAGLENRNNVYSQLVGLKLLLDESNTAIASNNSALVSHKSSGDHDTRYHVKANTYTRDEVKSQIGIYTNKSSFVDGGNFTDLYTSQLSMIDGGEWE